MNHTRPTTSGSQACAACKYQRRKCAANCALAPYFPPDHQKQFLNAHKLFGVSNIVKSLNNLQIQKEKDELMKSMIYEADVRANDPVFGCTRIIFDLQQKINRKQAELNFVKHQLNIYGARTVQIQFEPPSFDHVLPNLNINNPSLQSQFQFTETTEYQQYLHNVPFPQMTDQLYARDNANGSFDLQEYNYQVKFGNEASSSSSSIHDPGKEPFVDESEDIKPILSTFEERQPPPLVPFESKGVVQCSDKVVIKNQDVASLYQEQERDLKAACQFSLTNE